MVYDRLFALSERLTRSRAAAGRTRAALARARDYRAAIARLACFALEDPGPEELHREAVRLLHDVTEADLAGVFEREPAARALVLRASAGYSRVFENVVRIGTARTTHPAAALGRAGPVLFGDAAGSGRLALPPILRDLGVRSGLAVRVTGPRGVWGLLALHALGPREFGDAEAQLVEEVADVLGRSMRRGASVRALDVSRRSFQALAEHLPDIVVRLDRKLSCVYANRGVRRLGVAPESLIGERFDSILAMHPLFSALEGAVRMGAHEGRTTTVERRSRKDPEGIATFECLIAPEPGPERNVLVVFRDITRRKTAEDWLRYQATLLEAIGESVGALDLEGRVIFWNRRAEESLGMPADEVLGRNIIRDILDREHHAVALAGLRQVREGREWSSQLRLKRSDGTTFPAFVIATPVRNDRGELTGIVAAATDLTERARLEEQLRQAQKMEAVGRLAGGVAHDFNNLLTSITGHADLLLDEPQLPAHGREFADEIREAATRATRLTRQLLAFSRKQVLQPRVIDAGRIVEDMEKLLARVIGEDLELVLSPGSPSATVRADPTQIEQVILNLAVNARDAMPSGGRLSILVENRDISVPLRFPETRTELRPGPYVVISVQDTGPGIPESIRPYIFEPFFTTKGKEKGTGLGLATVLGIVEQSGGGVEVQTAPGEGSTFSVYLPQVSVGPRSREPEPPSRDQVRAEGRTILVVEDDDAVRSLLVRVLPRLGYRVLEAADGIAALEVCRDRRGEIDLVLTDVVMPRMGGGELAARLGEEHPDLPVLFMSGYADEMLDDRSAPATSREFLEKPFSAKALATRIRDALRDRDAGEGEAAGEKPD